MLAGPLGFGTGYFSGGDDSDSSKMISLCSFLPLFFSGDKLGFPAAGSKETSIVYLFSALCDFLGTVPVDYRFYVKFMTLTLALERLPLFKLVLTPLF